MINKAELTITTDGIINGTIYQSDVRIYFNTEVEDVRYVEGEGLISGALAIKCHDSYYNTDDEVRAELFIKDGHRDGNRILPRLCYRATTDTRILLLKY